MPGADDRQKAQQAIQDNHGEAEAISAQEVVNFELKAGAKLDVNPGAEVDPAQVVGDAG